MNIKENVTLSLEYFNFIKNISTSFLDYIKQYQFISIEYHQKLLLLNTTFKRNISDIFDKITKTKLDFSKIFDFINTIPKIMDSHLETLLFFTEDITKQMDLLEDKTIIQIISTCETQFNDFKKNLMEEKFKYWKTKTLRNASSISKIKVKYNYPPSIGEYSETKVKSKINEIMISLSTYTQNSKTAAAKLIKEENLKKDRKSVV